MNGELVDLRSDTVTRPNAAMRAAMAAAEVGDDVLGEDPTVKALETRSAALLGKETALFVPSGTMANLLAVLSQTQPGDAVLLSEEAHPYHFESGNLGMVAGVLARPIPAMLGLLTPDDIAARIVRTRDPHFAPTTLVEIENTTNRGGGAIYPLETVVAIADLAHAQGLRVHMDGARLFNAVVATGISAAAYAAPVDTVSFCLSKGLGAPVGSLLVGPADTLARAYRYRKMLGGGMRQAGILAAAGLYALEHHIDRLRDDHRRAAHFRAQLEGTRGIEFPMPSPTNMVYLDVADAQATAARLREHGVLVHPTAPRRIRCVFHLDIDDAQTERAIEAFAATLR